IHGGGWIGGDKSDFDVLLNTENLENLKKEFPDIAVFTLNYRLATSNANQYPAAEQDIKKLWILFSVMQNHIKYMPMLLISLAEVLEHILQLYTRPNIPHPD